MVNVTKDWKSNVKAYVNDPAICWKASQRKDRKKICSENSEDVLTWQVFRTLEATGQLDKWVKDSFGLEDHDGRGRPWKSRRSVINGILWVLRTGAPWADLPDRYPSFQTCHRRFQQWVRSGVMTKIMTALALKLTAKRGIDVREAFIDASFAPAKKGT